MGQWTHFEFSFISFILDSIMPFGYLQVFSKPPIVIILCVCSRSRQRDIGTGEFQHSILPASHRVSKLRDCLCSRRQNQRGYKESWSAKPRRLRGEWYKSIVRSQKAGPHRGSQEECSIPVTRRGKPPHSEAWRKETE